MKEFYRVKKEFMGSLGICAVDGCGKKVAYSGIVWKSRYCRSHYERKSKIAKFIKRFHLTTTKGVV